MKQQRDPDGIAELEYLLEKHAEARQRHNARSGRASGYRYFARAQLDAGRRFRAARIFGALAVRQRSLSDLGRALGSLVLGRRPGDVIARFRPTLRRLPEAEIAWLRGRSPEEIAWLRALTVAGIDPASNPAAAPDRESRPPAPAEDLAYSS
jgi:hypothetical protein